MNLRGRLIGLRQLIGGAAGALGGYIVGMTIQAFSFPLNFSILFFMGFLILMASFYYLARIEEQPARERDKNADPFVHIIADAKRILKTNKNFRNYLVADALVLMSLSAVSFYSIFALEKFSLPPSYGGIFSAIFMTTSIISNVVFGFSGDYYGHKVNVMGIALCSCGSSSNSIAKCFYVRFCFFLSCLCNSNSGHFPHAVCGRTLHGARASVVCWHYQYINRAFLAARNHLRVVYSVYRIHSRIHRCDFAGWLCLLCVIQKGS